MSRERPDYRENLILIRERFPDKITLSINEACQIVGVKDRRTLLRDKSFPAQMIGGKYAISITSLARYMS